MSEFDAKKNGVRRERTNAEPHPEMPTLSDSDNVAPEIGGCNPAMREEYLFTVQEFAEHVRMHEESIRRLCREGTLKHIRVGQQIRIPSGVLRDYIGGR